MDQDVDDQDLAYERAVLQARADPSQEAVIREAFLVPDDEEALADFRASEHWARIGRLLDSAGVEPGARIIDFGGGRGLVSAALARSGYDVTLCEPNPSEVCGRGAADRLRSDDGGFQIMGGDIADLSGQGFDAAVCRAVLHHVEPLVPVLTQLREALREGGALICSDEPTIRSDAQLAELRATHPFVRFGVDENALPVKDYLAALGAAGFRNARVEFPVAFGSYRRFVRPELPAALAALLYARYRARSAFFPVPGEVRSFVAQA